MQKYTVKINKTQSYIILRSRHPPRGGRGAYLATALSVAVEVCQTAVAAADGAAAGGVGPARSEAASSATGGSAAQHERLTRGATHQLHHTELVQIQLSAAARAHSRRQLSQVHTGQVGRYKPHAHSDGWIGLWF